MKQLSMTTNNQIGYNNNNNMSSNWSKTNPQSQTKNRGKRIEEQHTNVYLLSLTRKDMY